MTSMQSSVHVGVGHAAKELGVTLAEDIAVVFGGLVNSGRVGLESVLFSPFLLVLLLDLNEGIALLSLYLIVSQDSFLTSRARCRR